MGTRKDQYCTIRNVAEVINNWIDHKFDGLTGISGDRGQGKSVVSRLVARELSPIMCGQTLDLERAMIFSKTEFYDSAKKGDKKVIYLLDEAVGIFFNRDRMKSNQVELVKLINVIRSDYPAIFLNIPILWNLDKGIRDLIRMYIYVEKRPINGEPGYAHLFQKTNNAFDYDPWHLKENLKLDDRYFRSPNYRGTIILQDYSGEPWFVEMERLADSIKDRKKIEAVREVEEKAIIKGMTPEVIDLIRFMRNNRILVRKAGHPWKDKLCAYYDISLSHFDDLVGKKQDSMITFNTINEYNTGLEDKTPEKESEEEE